MAKYYLVGSSYDIYKRVYQNEVKIKKINGINLSSLIEIDKFTSSYDSIKIFEMIEKELGIKEINHLAIKYVINKNEDKSIYYRVINNNKLFNNSANSAVRRTTNILGKTRDTMFISRNDELYRQELEKMMVLVKNRDFDVFRKYYNLDNDFSFLVRRYMDTLYDNDLDKERDLELIKLEFSRYKTFRGWFVEQEKRKYNETINGNNRRMSEKDSKKKKDEIILSVDENISLFEKEFKDTNGVSYDEYLTRQFNEENEEFLDEEEAKEMFDYDNSRIVRKRR